MISDGSKRAYFEVEISLDRRVNEQTDFYNNTMTKVEDKMDLLFDKVGASEEILVKHLKNKGEISYMFKTTSRKRLGSIKNAVEKLLKNQVKAVEKTDCYTYRKDQFDRALLRYKKNNEIRLEESDKFVYQGTDLDIFKNKKNFFSWQLELENMLFERGSHVIKKAKDREIILYRCGKGNSGKSSFLKYLYFKNRKDIGFIDEGTSSQIISSVINNGTKKCFLIDLPRTRGEDLSGLMASIEKIKNGLCTKSMYGSGELLIMEVPWIIICSNYIPLGSFSVDRWKVYDLIPKKRRKDFEAVDITEEMKEAALDKILVEEYEAKKQEREVRKKAKEIRDGLKKESREVVF